MKEQTGLHEGVARRESLLAELAEDFPVTTRPGRLLAALRQRPPLTDEEIQCRLYGQAPPPAEEAMTADFCELQRRYAELVELRDAWERLVGFYHRIQRHEGVDAVRRTVESGRLTGEDRGRCLRIIDQAAARTAFDDLPGVLGWPRTEVTRLLTLLKALRSRKQNTQSL